MLFPSPDDFGTLISGQTEYKKTDSLFVHEGCPFSVLNIIPVIQMLNRMGPPRCLITETGMAVTEACHAFYVIGGQQNRALFPEGFSPTEQRGIYGTRFSLTFPSVYGIIQIILKRRCSMKSKKFTVYWLFVLIGVLAVSFYPLYMGTSVIADMLRDGTVLKENYPKYVIPYTPLAVAILIGILLMPLCIKLLKRAAVFGGSAVSIAVFFGAEFWFSPRRKPLPSSGTGRCTCAIRRRTPSRITKRIPRSKSSWENITLRSSCISI